MLKDHLTSFWIICLQEHSPWHHVLSRRCSTTTIHFATGTVNWGKSFKSLIFLRYQRQIGSLFATYPNQVRGLQNGNHFEVPVYLATARLSITIVVRLEQGFPDTPPTIQIHPPIAHRWVNHEGKVVGHEHLVNWNKNCALGRIVKDIEIEFNLRPPHPAVSINR